MAPSCDDKWSNCQDDLQKQALAERRTKSDPIQVAGISCERTLYCLLEAFDTAINMKNKLRKYYTHCSLWGERNYGIASNHINIVKMVCNLKWKADTLSLKLLVAHNFWLASANNWLWDFPNYVSFSMSHILCGQLFSWHVWRAASGQTTKSKWYSYLFEAISLQSSKMSWMRIVGNHHSLVY